MANLFKLSYLPYVLVAVGLVLIYVWAKTRGSVEGFDNTIPSPSGSNPWKFNMYYVDWCPHCHTTLPEFKKLGATQTIGGKTVACKAIEAEKNPELVRGKVAGYPTIQLYDAEGQLVKEYSGQRTVQGFQTFLEEALNRK